MRVISLILLIVISVSVFFWLDDGRIDDNWNYSIYQHGSILLEPDQRLIATSEEGGVFFTYDLDPDKTYDLSVGGQVIEGDAIMRIQLDGQNPQWYDAPEEAKQWIVEGERSIEVLIYSHSPFEYALTNLSLTDCSGTCATDRQLDQQLRELILDVIPGIAQTDDPIEKALLITDWASRNVVLGSTTNTSALESLSPGRLYFDYWQPRAGSGSCGSFAVFNARLLEMFGLDAFTIDFGMADGSFVTHVSTVLGIEEDSEWNYYLMDPTFNGTFWANDQVADLVDVIAGRLPEASFESVNFTRAAIRRTNFLEENGWASDCTFVPTPRFRHSTPRYASGAAYICENLRYNEYIRHEDSGWPELVRESGLTHGPNLIQDLLRNRILGIGPSENPQLSALFRQAIERLAIPIGSS